MDFDEIMREIKALEQLTEKRLLLLKAIMENEPCSIRELAEEIDRDIKNVFNDLRILHELDLVDFIVEGRRKRPIVKKKTIIIKLG